jgi:putative oxygen-independent coproporphyrinogen III oxidase
VEVHPSPPTSAYTDALLAQWKAVRPGFEGQPFTIFFGGGTPSLHPPGDLARLVQALNPVEDGEITLEANPGTVDAQVLKGLRDAGINRLSLGIQTFHEDHARFLNRAHSVGDARKLLAQVKQAGFRSWSADLIFALPHQTLDEFHRDLDALLETEPPHVSLYGLTAEPGTPYTRGLEKGQFPAQDTDLWADMYGAAVERLEAAGLYRYEVSAFARPGHRSAHNELYWRGHRYAGLGAGAHGWLPNGERTIGQVAPADFISTPSQPSSVERPDSLAAASDLILCTLRHVDGVDRARLRSLGHEILASDLAPWTRHGLLSVTEAAITLDAGGWAVSDALVRKLVESLVARS